MPFWLAMILICLAFGIGAESASDKEDDFDFEEEY